MPKGIPEPWNRCHGTTKRGTQCGHAKTPGTDYCRMHNGWTPTTQSAAAERIRRIESGMDPTVTPEQAKDILDRYYKSQATIAEHRMRKQSPELYKEWKATAERVSKEAEAKRKSLIQRLGPEKFAQLRKEERDIQAWLQSGGKGPRPGSAEFWGDDEDAELEAQSIEVTLPDEPATPDPEGWDDDDDGDRTPFQRTLDRFTPERGFVSQQAEPTPPPSSDPHAEARARGLLPPREPEREAEKPKGLLQYRMTEQREARRRAFAAARAQREAQAEAERMPETADGHGGGRVHGDVAPIPAAEFQARTRSPVSTGPIPYAGFDDGSWTQGLPGLRHRREEPFRPWPDDGSYEAF